MGTTTKNLGLYKPAANDYYNVETDQNENFDKIDEKFGKVDNGLKTKLDKGSYEGDADDLKREIDGKEPSFSKKSGFNKEKTDSYEEDNNNKLGTAKALYRLYNWVKDTFTVPWSRITEKPNLTSTEDLNRLLSHKEDTFVKNTGFNKNFGTTSGTVMEGDKYEVIKSIPGTTSNIKFIQDNVVKNKGDFCIDKHASRICKCIKQTSITTNDSNYFQDVTLDKLSDRLDYLRKTLFSQVQIGTTPNTADFNFVNGKRFFVQGSIINKNGPQLSKTSFALVVEKNKNIAPFCVFFVNNTTRETYIEFKDNLLKITPENCEFEHLDVFYITDF